MDLEGTPGVLTDARRRARRRPRRRAQRLPALPVAAPGAPRRGARPAHQHREPPDLRRRPAERVGPELALRVGVHAGARRPQRVQGRQRLGRPRRRRRPAPHRSATRCGARCAAATPPRGSAATSSPSSCATPRARRSPRSSSGCARWRCPAGVVIDFTVGTATSPRDSTDPAELYRIADARLYEKKGMLKR